MVKIAVWCCVCVGAIAMGRCLIFPQKTRCHVKMQPKVVVDGERSNRVRTSDLTWQRRVETYGP